MNTHSSWTPNLGRTALWTAAARAEESRRPEPLFVDPWAGRLSGAEGERWLAARPVGSSLPMVLRTRFFDDFLVDATAVAHIPQVVILAAGYDTRAYRLHWPPGVHVFEVDQEPVLSHKTDVLTSAGATPACDRRPVVADLTTDWTSVLGSAGFNPSQPSCFLLEGLLFYLETSAIGRLLDECCRLICPGGRIGFDAINSEMLSSPLTKGWVGMQAAAGAPWIGTLDNPKGYLENHGFVPHLTVPGAPDANHGRWQLPVIPAGLQGAPHLWFATAVRHST